MNKFKTMDANEAVANVAYKFSEVCGIYPITPASPMAEKVDLISNTEELNFFNNKTKVIEMQSEQGAVALVHGALNSGVLATTFTASQGLWFVRKKYLGNQILFRYRNKVWSRSFCLWRRDGSNKVDGRKKR